MAALFDGEVRPVEIARQIDDAAQGARVAKPRTGADEVRRAGHRRLPHPVGKAGGADPGDPDAVCAGDLAAVDSEQLAQLDCPGPGRSGRAHDERPAAGRPEPAPGDVGAARQRVRAGQLPHGPHADRVRGAADAKARDGGGRRRPGEGFGGRFQDVQGDAPELVEKQPAQRGAVVHVQPLGRGDERTDVADPGQESRLQEEVQVQAGQGAGLDAEVGEARGVPRLPVPGDVVMPYVRRVAHESGRAVAVRQADVAIVGDQDGGAARPAADAQVVPQHQRGQRVELDGHEPRGGERGAGGQEKTAGTGTRVDDAFRPALAAEPRRHRAHDRLRRVDGSGGAAGAGATDRREGVAERVGAARDRPPGGVDRTGRDRGVRRRRRQRRLGRGQLVAPSDQRQAQSDELRFGPREADPGRRGRGRRAHAV